MHDNIYTASGSFSQRPKKHVDIWGGYWRHLQVDRRGDRDWRVQSLGREGAVVDWGFFLPDGRGHVLAYAKTCTNMGRKMGDTVWVGKCCEYPPQRVQHPQWAEYGYWVITLRNSTGEHGPWGPLQEKSHRWRIHALLIGLKRARVWGPKQAPGRISIFFHDYPHWKIESHQTFGPHILIFQTATGQKCWFVIGCYFPSGSISDTEKVVTVIVHWQEGMDQILVGDINVDLYHPEGREWQGPHTNDCGRGFQGHGWPLLDMMGEAGLPDMENDLEALRGGVLDRLHLGYQPADILKRRGKGILS